LKKSRLEQSRAESMVYVHINLRLIYRQREEWLKGKTKMWDVFPDDMGLDDTVELALANMDLNDPVLEPVTFEDDIPLEGSSSIAANPVPQFGLDDHAEQLEIGGESSGDDIDFDDDEYCYRAVCILGHRLQDSGQTGVTGTFPTQCHLDGEVLSV
jgi:hypothetical protein